MKHQELRDAAMIQGLGGSEIPMFPHVWVPTGMGSRELPGKFFKKKRGKLLPHSGNVAYQDVTNFKNPRSTFFKDILS